MLKSGDIITHMSSDWTKFERLNRYPVSKDGVLYRCSFKSITPDPHKIYIHWQDYEITSVVIEAVSKTVKIKKGE